MSSDDEIRAEMHRKARAHAEAMHYSLNNPYLTREQKAEVEAVYQVPFGVFSYAFAYFSLYMGMDFVAAYGDAAILSALAWLACRTFMNPRIWLPVAFVVAGVFGTVLHLAIAAFALYRHRWGVAAFMGLEAFGLLAVFMPPMWLWAIFLGGRLNPKYRIAKKLFGIEFPFEADADSPSPKAKD
jgi:hypothetical protein